MQGDIIYFIYFVFPSVLAKVFNQMVCVYLRQITAKVLSSGMHDIVGQT